MTMIAVGQGLRGIANKGLQAVARAESVENQQRMGMEAQKKAAESQTMGTGAGIGGMVGATKVAANTKAANDAVAALNAGIGDAGTVGVKGGGLTFTPPPPAGTTELVQGAETIKGVEATAKIKEVAAAADTAIDVKNAATAVKTTAEVAEVAAVGTEVVGSTATSGLATTAGTAASSTGTMASLMTLAGPIAIGLGAAFLINKLFD
tara:strand:+ start:222 stop:842 length:621 start_codon:yes stop_codon:yes gene_type:complete